MAKRAKVTGKQVRGDHTSLIDACDHLIRLLKKIPDVGIAPGRIQKKARGGSGQSIKFQYKEWGLSVQVTSPLYVQSVGIRTGNKKRAKEVFEIIEPSLGRSYNRIIEP